MEGKKLMEEKNNLSRDLVIFFILNLPPVQIVTMETTAQTARDIRTPALFLAEVHMATSHTAGPTALEPVACSRESFCLGHVWEAVTITAVIRIAETDTKY